MDKKNVDQWREIYTQDTEWRKTVDDFLSSVRWRADEAGEKLNGQKRNSEVGQDI